MNKKKINNNELTDKAHGSYERLSNFVWERAYIKNKKKAIMTIPYNVTFRSMKEYLKGSLVRLDYDKEI